MVFLVPLGKWQQSTLTYATNIFSVVISVSFMWLYKKDKYIYEWYDPAA
jgi:hypothetical protein